MDAPPPQHITADSATLRSAQFLLVLGVSNSLQHRVCRNMRQNSNQERVFTFGLTLKQLFVSTIAFSVAAEQLFVVHL